MGFSGRTYLNRLCSERIASATTQCHAKGEQISAKQLESMSRLSFTLRDAKQTAYTVYIFAYDEQKRTLTEENGWTNNKKGDKSYSGTYRAALLKKVQHTELFRRQNWI